MIQVKNLVKTFDHLRALDGLTLHVPQGAVYGLVGPNGSGKTTAIRHIAGVYRQDSGEVLVQGKPVYENTDVKSRIAYVPDDQFYFPQAGVRAMADFYRNVYPQFDMARYYKLKEVFGLDEKRPIRKLSKGMQKQASFWLSLCLHPEIMILDEPVDGLDPVMRRQVWSLMLGEVAEQGTTILVSSHNLRELEDVCDHVGIIYKGKTIVERSLSELQGNISKLQYVMKEYASLPPDIQVLHHAESGKVQIDIVRESAEALEEKMKNSGALFYDVIPLTLEEIFVYELGGLEYEAKEILL